MDAPTQTTEVIVALDGGLRCGPCGTDIKEGEEYVLVDGDPVHLDCSLEDATVPSAMDEGRW